MAENIQDQNFNNPQYASAGNQYVDGNYADNGNFVQNNNYYNNAQNNNYDPNAQYYDDQYAQQQAVEQANGQYYQDPNAMQGGDYSYNQYGDMQAYNQNTYAPNNTPLDASQFGKQQQVDTSNMYVVPGQDGVPLNISEEGLAKLNMTEKLYRMGAIGDKAYSSVREKYIARYAPHTMD